MLNCVIFQLVREDREHALAKSSFAIDSQIFAELDEIAGTTSATTYKREVLLQFVQSKGWKIEMIAEIPDVEPSAPSVADSEPELIGPKQHIVFHSSSENSSQVPSPVTESQKDEGKDD